MTILLHKQPESICILRLSAIGDACHTLPVVRTIQAHWPRAKITWVIGKVESLLVGDIPEIEFIVLNKRRGTAGYMDVRRALKGRKFDLLLHMHRSFRANIASMMIKADTRVGFDKHRSRDLQWMFVNQNIEPHERQHVLDGLFGFAESLGIKDRVLRWDIPIPDADFEFANAKRDADRELLIINPCSSEKRGRKLAHRNWRADRYAAVADYAAERWNMQVMFTGSPAQHEVEHSEEIRKYAAQEHDYLAGRTTLKQLLALVAQASAVISPDSGPVHMSAATNTPCIGLYASSDPGRTGPCFSSKYLVDKYPEALMADKGLSPDKVPWGTRVHDPSAMDLINITDVVEKLDMIMRTDELGDTTVV